MRDCGLATADQLAELQERLAKALTRLIGSAVDADGRPQTDEFNFVKFDEKGFVFLVLEGRAITAALRHRRYMSCMGYVTDGPDTLVVGFSGKVHELSGHTLIERVGSNADAYACFELFDGRGCVRQADAEWRYLVGKTQPQVNYYVTNSCTGCGVCVAACPQLAIDMTKSPVMINQVTCIHCGTCYEQCPYHAIVKL